jgi:hypothetical protein
MNLLWDSSSRFSITSRELNGAVSHAVKRQAKGADTSDMQFPLTAQKSELTLFYTRLENAYRRLTHCFQNKQARFQFLWGIGVAKRAANGD